jgi:hypothetical protein
MSTGLYEQHFESPPKLEFDAAGGLDSIGDGND